MPRYTEDDIALLRAMHAAGAPFADIGHALGRSSTSTAQQIYRLDLPRRLKRNGYRWGHPLLQELERLREEQGWTRNALARRAGLSASVLTRWKTGSVPNIATFEAMLNALGYELVVVERRP